MSSFQDLAARASARGIQAAQNTPEINMEIQSEDQENDTLNDDGLDNDVSTMPPRRLTADELIPLIRRYNLPEATIADVERFQRVFSQLMYFFDTNQLNIRSSHSWLPPLN
jgi:hypothetical protein